MRLAVRSIGIVPNNQISNVVVVEKSQQRGRFRRCSCDFPAGTQSVVAGMLNAILRKANKPNTMDTKVFTKNTAFYIFCLHHGRTVSCIL